MPTVSLSFLTRGSFLNKGKTKQVCRVCHELAEIKAEHLCHYCVWIKAQISARFAEVVRGTIAIPAPLHCERPGCSCAACDGKTLAPHPVYPFDLARADRREIHFHPRCHELWLEVVNGPNGGADQALDGRQG